MKTISIPFSFTSDTGAVVTTSSLKEIVEQEIIDILTTSSNERVMNPAYGANLRSLLFEELDPLVFAEYRVDALSELNDTLSLGKVVDLNISIPQQDYSGDDTDTTVRISVKYAVPPYGTSVLTFNLTNTDTAIYGGA